MAWIIKYHQISSSYKNQLDGVNSGFHKLNRQPAPEYKKPMR